MASWRLGNFMGGSAPTEFVAASCPSNTEALSNRVFFSPSDSLPLDERVKIQSCVYLVGKSDGISKGQIGLSSQQRRELRIALGDLVSVTSHNPRGGVPAAAAVTFEVCPLKRMNGPLDLQHGDLASHARRSLVSHVPSARQPYLLDHFGVLLVLRAISLASTDGSAPKHAEITEDTELYFVKAPGSEVRLRGAEARHAARKDVFKADFDFEKMGIGGLDREFSDIFRRAFASRVFPPAAIEKLGIQHVKGMLLYGPPGTGKTLIARQIGKMLNGKEPKVVNGPEILNKFVGQSEENIRKLFEDAEKDFAENGEASELHIIIFDEIDAICKQRGTTGGSTGVHDTVVNQLLSKIDGVNALNNILVIGMTNRKDMIDEALLRPGRLEVHVEISLPDEHGRQQILTIHTAKMRQNRMLASDVNIPQLASSTKNYSGAEIEGLCKSAAAFALNRHVDYKNLQRSVDTSGMCVTMDDFRAALTEVQPAFGMGSDDFARCLFGGFLLHGTRMRELLSAGVLFRDEVARSSRSPLVSVLIEGAPGTGKTALAAMLAADSGFPFVRLISPEAYVGYSEPAKCAAIAKAFDDAHKSPLSVIVLDDIERMIEYTPIGPRFSNITLQTLMILCKQVPPKGRRLLVIATTSCPDVLAQLDFRRSFSAFLETDYLEESEIAAVINGTAEGCSVSRGNDESDAKNIAAAPAQFRFRTSRERDTALALLAGERIGIQKLLMVLHMAKIDVGDGQEIVDVGRLTQILKDVV